MILAQNSTQALIVLLVGMLCWGLWASMFKLTGKWRYELFYFDVAIGLAIAALIYAFTLGSMGFDGFSFQDDVMHAGKQKWALAFAAGAVFNLANMLMMGGVVVAGLSIAVPLGLGISLMVGVGVQLISGHTGNPMMVFIGSACLLVAVVIMGVAYSFLVSQRVDRMVAEGKVKTTNHKAMIVSTNAPSATKGLLLSILAGAVMWGMIPLVNNARSGDFGLGPYALLAFFALGLFFSTLVFNLFFLNLPIDGEPVDVIAYFQGGLRPHIVGIGAGAALCSGILAYLVAQGGPPEAQVHTLTAYTVQQGAVLVAAVVGIFGWKDFRDCEPKVRAMLWTFLILFAVGLAALGFASKSIPGAA